MRYANLKELYDNSAGCRQFLLSQPVEMQMLVARRGAFIHTAADLYAAVFEIEKEERARQIGKLP